MPSGDVRASTLLDWEPPLQPRDFAVVYSTGLHQRAFGEDGRPTRFAAAVLQALDGLAAERGADWEIRSDNLAVRIGRIIDWEARGAVPEQRVAGGGEPKGGVVRALTAAPSVPFRLALRPSHALRLAWLHLADRFDNFERPPAPDLWESRAAAGAYEFTARFETDAAFATTRDFVSIEPPNRELRMEVDPS